MILGLKNEEIASSLGNSRNTVKQHLKALYTGLNLFSRTELAVWCEQHPAALQGEWVASPPDFRPRLERKGMLIEGLLGRKVA